MYKLKTKASFDSAHFLKDYEGKCSNIHGHRWTVENFAKYIYDEMTSRGYNVIEASVYETPNNVASYCE